MEKINGILNDKWEWRRYRVSQPWRAFPPFDSSSQINNCHLWIYIYSKRDAFRIHFKLEKVKCKKLEFQYFVVRREKSSFKALIELNRWCCTNFRVLEMWFSNSHECYCGRVKSILKHSGFSINMLRKLPLCTSPIKCCLLTFIASSFFFISIVCLL